MAEPIEMVFGLRTRVGQGNHILDGVKIPLWEGAILRGKGATHCKVWGHSAVICAKMAELVEMPFGLLARMSPRNHEFDGDPDLPIGRGCFEGEGRPLQSILCFIKKRGSQLMSITLSNLNRFSKFFH